MRRTLLVGIAAALLITAGTGVALFDGDSAQVGQSENTAKSLRDASAGGAAAADDMAAPPVAASTAAEPQQQTPRVTAGTARVVKTASLSLSVSDARVAKVTDSVSSVAAQYGGFVASTQRDSGEAKSSVVTIRVPAAHFDDALVALRKLGKVSDEEVGGEDVTGQLVDLAARLRSLQAQEQALNTLMARAATVGETLQVAQAVADVRTQIEQLAGQQHQLADQADYATITASVLGPQAVNPAEPNPEPVLVQSVQRAAGATLAVLGGLVVVLGVVLPLALLGLVVVGACQVVRRLRHRVPLADSGTV